MKRTYYFYLLLNILLISPAFSQNLLTNGNFEAGGSGTGFVTNGAGYTFLPVASYGTTTQGNFAIANNPKPVNTAIFISGGDHTSGKGNMLLFDGNSTAASSFWSAGNTGAGVTGLTIGRTYYFSYWIKSISTDVIDPATQANITFTTPPTGATIPVPLAGSTLAPLPAQGWRQVVYSFVATATTVTLNLQNTNVGATGNDFAVDDFMLTSTLNISYNVTDADCTIGNNGSVTVTAFGGTAPYSYTLTGPGSTNVTNTTGLFTGLQPGTYAVSVTDTSVPTPIVITSNNIVVGPTISILASSTTICSGNPITLTASGSSSGYTWTASPTDATLVTNIPNPTVTPTVTTTYTVNSTIGLCAAMTSSVTVNALALGISATPNPLCVGGISTLRAVGYTFNSSVGNPLNAMAGATTVLNSGNDNTPSAVLNIGFNFSFGGTTYTQYTVSPDGWLALGSTVAVAQPTNTTINTQNTPRLYPFWDDLATGTNGNVRVLVTGTAPNRILIVQWSVTIPRNTTGPANSTFQMWLYEGTNTIEYHYGPMGAQTSNSISAGYTSSATNFNSITFSTNSSSGVTPNDANNTVPTFGTTYTYSPLTSLIWSPIANLYTNPAATTAYTGDSRAIVYAANVPLAGTTYQVTGTSLSGCSAVADVALTVSDPTATISGTAQVCSGLPATVTFNGTPNATVTYKLNGGTNQTIVLDAAGVATITIPSVTSNYLYTLVNVISAAPALCTKLLTGSVTISANIQLGVTATPNPICVGGTSAIRATGYTFTPGTGALNPMVGATTVVNSAVDNTPAIITNIGFPFNFGGNTYTQYSVSPDGFIVLGTAGSSQPVNSTTSFQNTPKIYPFWDDMTTGTDGNVRVLVTGTAPNRIFIVEWNVTVPKNIAGPANSTFQAWLYETTNVIEYHYGAIGAQTSNSISGGYSVNPTNYSSLTFNSNSASTTAPNDLNNSVPPPGTVYTYTPLTSLIWSPTTNLFNDAAATIPYTGDSRDLVYTTNVPVAGGSTYTVTGSNPAGCTSTATTTVTVSVPTASVAVTSITICPGNTATFTITGTPNSIVTISANGGADTYTPNIGPLGTGSFTTPPLNATTVYDLILVKGILTLCETTLTGVSVTVVVVPNGCATVQTVPAPGNLEFLIPFCSVGECRTLQANISDVPSTTSYVVSTIPYCPQALFNDPTYNQVPITIDDIWSNVITLPFNFCFFNQNYTTCQVGTNGVLSFRQHPPGPTCRWDFTNTIPNTDFSQPGNLNRDVSNAIYGVYQDLNPNVAPTPPAVTSVNWKLTGTYPCRKLIVNYDSVAQFSCGNGVGLQTSQIVLYEVSNIIEVYVERRVPCTGWNSGSGVIGIQNAAGTVAYAPANRNTGSWSATQEAYRFTPTGPNVPVTITWLQGTTVIGNGPTVTVCPTVTTVYTLQANYDVCGVQQTATSTQTLTVNDDLTNSPSDLNPLACNNIYDLTLNDDIILGTLDPTDYIITYHTTLADAQDEFSTGIPNSTSYSPGVTHIFASIFIPALGCRIVKTFELLPCDIEPEPVPPLTLCESSYLSGTAHFNLTLQSSTALGPTRDPLDYTITYHTSQANADNNIAISPANDYIGSEGQIIVVRITDNADPTQYGTGTFILHVNTLPTASITGTITICSTFRTQVCFQGTPNATVTYDGPGANDQTVVLDATGNACIWTPYFSTTVAYDEYYTLNSVEDAVTHCVQNLTQQVIISVIPLPTANISGTIAVCVDEPDPVITFTGADGTPPYIFTYLEPDNSSHTVSSGAGNTATISVDTANDGTFTYTLVSVQSATSPSCSQLQSGTVTVTVNPLPTATISGTIGVCKDSSPDPLITFSGFDGTAPYIFTYLDANNVSHTIPTLPGDDSVSIAVPTTAVGVFTYTLVSVEDSSTTNCTQLQGGTATITVNDNPVITAPTPYVVCDDNNDGNYCLFDLTTKDSEITSAPNVVAYYQTLTDAQIGAIPPLTSPYCNNGIYTLYARVYDPATPACYSTTTLSLVVNPTPHAPAVITAYELCDYTAPAGDGIEQFTLNTKDIEIINGQSDVAVSYYLSQGDATTQTGALPNLYTNTTPNDQIIWINIHNIITGCNSVSSFHLIVNPLPVVTTPPTIFQCSNGATNQALFNLTINEGVVTGGVTGLTVTYYTTPADAQGPSNAIANPLSYLGTDNQTVYIRVENDATGCYSTTTQLLRVTLGPVAVTPQALHYCDPNNDGFGVFNLEDATNEIAGGSVPAGVTVSYYETQTDAIIGAVPSLASPYHNINPWTQTIWVKVFYTLTGCSNYVQLQLIVDPTPEATTPDDYHLCDYTGGTGFESFDLTTTIAQVLGSIDPTLNTVTFYTSLANAQGPSNAITNVTGYTNTPAFAQTLYVRVETIATGCYDIVELRLVVDRLPNATQPNYPQYSLCDYTGAVAHETFDLASQVTGILLGQTGMDVTFYPSLTAAQNGTIGTSINETNPDLQYINGPPYVQTLGIRITNALTGCYVVSTMDIRVNPLPSPIPPTAPYTLCDGNQDGITAFDLTTLIPALLQGAPYIITFHETLTDANSNGTTIPNPGSYTNINPFVQTIYVRAEDPVTHCFSVIPIELNVNASPMALTAVDLEDIVLCDDEDNNNQDATRYVDLTVRTAAALLPQPLADNDYTVRYYEDQAAAIDGTLPIIPANHYLGSNADTIWVRVEDKVTGCYNLGSFELVINTPLALTTPAPLNECDNDVPSNDQHFTFDLTVKDTEINQGTGYTVTYYPNSPITAGSVAIANPTAYYAGPVQTLGVMVTSPEGCRSYTTLDIRVLPVPTPQQNPPTLPATCEDATGSGVAQLDLTANSAYIINGDPSVTLHYFPSQVDLDANTNEILSPATAVVGDPSIAGTTINQVQYVYITVSSSVFSDYTGRPCYQQVTQGFIINPLPSVVSIPDYQICEDDAVPDGIEVFDLTTQNAALLAGNLTTPVSNYSVAFYEDPGLTTPIANPSSYSNTSNPQNIFVQVTNTTTNCKSDVSQFNILVNPKPILTLPAIMQVPYTSCDTDGDNDGQMLYPQSPSSPLPSLAGYVDTILGTQGAPEFAVEFYDNQADAQAGNSTSALTGLDTYQVQSGRYYIRVTNTITGCYQTASFDVVIEKLAEPFITSNTGSTIACVRFNTTTVSNDLILDSNITAPNYTFNWYADGVPIAGAHQSTYPVTSIGADQVTYTVEAVSVNPPMLGCTSVITPLSTFTVTRSGPAANLDYAVTNAFSENQIITVTNEGYGVYQYSLDDGPRQDSPVFENVPMGIHTVYVWDVRDPNYSCDVAFIEGVQTIDYPHYFTPNGDGIHDTWNIRGLEYQGGAKIYIFDRYGKLIKQISSSGNGWDGTYNSHLMPSDDYWFTVEYLEQATAREFKAHFSLKR